MQIVIKDISELASTARQLIKHCQGKKIFAFQGEMGVGKTTFIKSICEELGSEDVTSSPTFSIVNEYRSAADEKIFHFDFYRIKDVSEAYDMGYEDYLYSGAWCFIEWPEKIESIIPPEVVWVSITQEGSSRIISF